jgi:hypothetical protein
MVPLKRERPYTRLWPHAITVTNERPQLRTLEEAVAGPGEIADPYLEHLEAARKIAEEYLDAELVLARFCEQAGIG